MELSNSGISIALDIEITPSRGITNPELFFDNEEEKVDTPPSSNYDTLVLSGGGNKGILTLGALQYAQDNSLLKDVHTFIGTSSGAMIGYLLAIGYTPVEIMVYICTNQIFEKLQQFNIVNMIQGGGAVSYASIQEHIERLTIEKIGYLPTMKDLHTRFGKTFICVTYNITKDAPEYLTPDTHGELPCLIALRLSSNLPLVFENYRYGNSLYIDGAVVDNFPIDMGDRLGNKILGISLSFKMDIVSSNSEQNILEFIYKLINIPLTQSIAYKIENVSDKCTVIILDGYDSPFLNFNINSKIKLDMFSHGYQKIASSF